MGLGAKETGAVMFADISGFTALTEHLAERGPAGAEQLTEALNSYFDLLIETIAAYGGEVVLFAGDAVLAAWSSADKALVEEALAAASCRLDIRERLNCRVAGGISAPGAHRTGHETLASSGSCHPTYGLIPNCQCANKTGSWR